MQSITPAKELLARVDDWLQLPGQRRRMSAKQIEDFLDVVYFLPCYITNGSAVPDELPYLQSYSALRKLRTGEAQIGDPAFREQLIVYFIKHRTSYDLETSREVAAVFLTLET